MVNVEHARGWIMTNDATVEAEEREWNFCPLCGFERKLWDVGTIRVLMLKQIRCYQVNMSSGRCFLTRILLTPHPAYSHQNKTFSLFVLSARLIQHK